jgi:catechol 2,3-dioxygenase-like lactoylglutathione lyase family enzyme
MARRIHVAINVTDLPAAVSFYEALFAAAPTKVVDAFAKFELDEPNLNLALNLVDAVQGPEGAGVLSHLGLQVDDAAAVAAYAERWQGAGLRTKVGASVAGQDKVWAYDPDGNEWEVFFE